MKEVERALVMMKPSLREALKQLRQSKTKGGIENVPESSSKLIGHLEQ